MKRSYKRRREDKEEDKKKRKQKNLTSINPFQDYPIIPIMFIKASVTTMFHRFPTNFSKISHKFQKKIDRFELKCFFAFFLGNVKTISICLTL